ncbi:hypothetical protein PG999_002035 [Apiospora kogelbergensis]|uniref:Biogenesis of lysosome-related organelles complex 1 subunit 1 n=1 Tax=Apiospora kogelbergensis TaxID=1337665 RepID=A0AAW0R768_9PEZI
MSAAGPSSAPAPPQPGPAGVTKSVSAAMATGSKPTSAEPENAAPSQSTSSPLSPLSPRTSMAQAMATNVTASGTTSIPSPSSTAGILPSPALSSPSFPSYITSPSSRAGPSTSSAATPQQQQQPRSHPGAPPSSNSQAASTRGGPPSTTNTNTSAAMPLHAHLPSTTTTLHMTEARDALVATMSNLFDTELQSRASLLHANASQLSRQEADVTKATEGLRKETDKLAKVARDAGKKIKETGNVQNWAEVLERDFLVLEETLRLAREGDGGSDGGYSSSGSSYWSGSDAGSEDGDGRSRRASMDRGREEGAAVAAKVAGKAPAPLGEGGSVGTANEMDIDDAVGYSAGAPESSGKTVEELIVQDGGAGGAEDAPTTAAADLDVDMDGTSGTPAGRGGKAAGEEAGAEAEGQDNNSPFSHVDNAIEASIREAMATSMHDDDPTALARSETTLEGGSTSSVHRKAKEMADYDKMDLDASERSFPSTGRTLSRESVSDVASGSGPLPPAAI